jgi:UbiD family decarboxylase
LSFRDLRSLIKHLEDRRKLVRVKTEVDPYQELTVIQHRVLAENGPALLFENVKGSPYRLVSNLFGTKERVEMVFGGPPEELGNKVVRLFEQVMPPMPANLWKARKMLWEVLKTRFREVSTGPVMATVTEPADLMRLPVLTCWPEDGGPFFTLPLVHSVDPVNGRGNLGIYRLQRFDASSTGMHWQIEKGGHFHFHRAKELGQPLPVSVILGGPPALTIAAVAPLPEGFDERLLATYMMGMPLDVIFRKETGHLIPATSEFVLEGTVTDGDVQLEGPFGDHFGHYSHSSNFPVFRVKRILARKDAIYPATVVGKPVQEDFHIGAALQEMAGPFLRLTRPAVSDIWAYPETGFHPLAVMSVKQRYPREALKHTLGMLGEGQVSLTKIMITVDHEVNVRDFDAVSRALWRHLKADDGLHLLAPTAQDTLDFTGPAMNSGSRLVLIATRRDGETVRIDPPPSPPSLDGLYGINEMTAWGPSFLMVRLKEGAKLEKVREALGMHPVTRQYLFHVLISPDVSFDNKTMMLWGWFTRFDPLTDLHPYDRVVQGNRLIFDFPITIDARWKEGYPKPVEFDPAIEKQVNEKWSRYNIANRSAA